MSYKGVVTNSFDNMKLNFDDIFDWNCEDWIESNRYFNDEEFFMQKILPGLAEKGYLDDSVDPFDGDNLWKTLGVIVTGAKDLWNLKNRLKELCREIYDDFIFIIPQTSELQQEAYKRIVNFMTQL